MKQKNWKMDGPLLGHYNSFVKCSCSSFIVVVLVWLHVILYCGAETGCHRHGHGNWHGLLANVVARVILIRHKLYSMVSLHQIFSQQFCRAFVVGISIRS